MKKTLIFCLLAFCLASAAKQSLAVLPCIGDFDAKGLERLRNKVEEVAREVLPPDGFRLIPYKNVREQIGDEALFNACKEGGVCFGDLAGKANADYGAWCMVNKYGGKLLLSFQLYSVGEKDILYTKEYDSYNPKNAEDMVEIIKREVPGAFREKIPGAVKISKTPVSLVEDGTGGASGGYLADSRDGKRYKTVKIGKQTWMAENLNYNARGSKCYGNQESNCQKYGKIYDWESALNACPKGWHLPSDAEWTTLTDFVGGSSTAGTKLKAARGWNSNGNGEDKFGFSALPGGRGFSNGDFIDIGNDGYWWSSTDKDSFNAYYRDIYYNYVYKDYGDKPYLLSVRCVQD